MKLTPAVVFMVTCAVTMATGQRNIVRRWLSNDGLDHVVDLISGTGRRAQGGHDKTILEERIPAEDLAQIASFPQKSVTSSNTQERQYGENLEDVKYKVSIIGDGTKRVYEQSSGGFRSITEENNPRRNPLESGSFRSYLRNLENLQKESSDGRSKVVFGQNYGGSKSGYNGDIKGVYTGSLSESGDEEKAGVKEYSQQKDNKKSGVYAGSLSDADEGNSGFEEFSWNPKESKHGTSGNSKGTSGISIGETEKAEMEFAESWRHFLKNDNSGLQEFSWNLKKNERGSSGIISSGSSENGRIKGNSKVRPQSEFIEKLKELYSSNLPIENVGNRNSANSSGKSKKNSSRNTQGINSGRTQGINLGNLSSDRSKGIRTGNTENEYTEELKALYSGSFSSNNGRNRGIGENGSRNSKKNGSGRNGRKHPENSSGQYRGKNEERFAGPVLGKTLRGYVSRYTGNTQVRSQSHEDETSPQVNEESLENEEGEGNEESEAENEELEAGNEEMEAGNEETESESVGSSAEEESGSSDSNTNKDEKEKDIANEHEFKIPFTIKHVPYPVKVPFPVHIPKPYPVKIEKRIPVPIPIKVPHTVVVPVVRSFLVKWPVPHPILVPQLWPILVNNHKHPQ